MKPKCIVQYINLLKINCRRTTESGINYLIGLWLKNKCYVEKLFIMKSIKIIVITSLFKGKLHFRKLKLEIKKLFLRIEMLG